MTIPPFIAKIAAVALFAAAIGVGAALSAPSPGTEPARTVSDEAFRPGDDGIDYAIVTGPVAPSSNKVPACADPARRGNLKPCL